MKLSQQVGAEPQFDAGFQRDLDALQAGREHRLEFRDTEGRQLGPRRFAAHDLVGHQRGYEIAAALRQQFGGRRIDQVAVLDRSNPRLGGPGNRRRRVGMGGDIGAPTSRLVDDGLQLLIRVLRRGQGIRRRHHATGEKHFDVIHALAKLLARGDLDARLPIRYHRHESQRIAAATETFRLHAPAYIAVPTRLRERSPRDVDARALDRAFGHGTTQPPIRAAHIAHRRETTLQRSLQQPRGASRHERRRAHRADSPDSCR